MASLEKQQKFLNDFMEQKPDKFKSFVSSLINYEKREISIEEVYDQLKGAIHLGSNGGEGSHFGRGRGGVR